MNPGHHMDDKQLRKATPQAARLAVLSYLESVDGNISRTARVFGTKRSVVYDILKKQACGDLNDRSRAPRRQLGKIPTKSLSSQQDTRHYGISSVGADFVDNFAASSGKIPTLFL